MSRVHANGAHDIAYDDGDWEKQIPRSRLRLLQDHGQQPEPPHQQQPQAPPPQQQEQPSDEWIKRFDPSEAADFFENTRSGHTQWEEPWGGFAAQTPYAHAEEAEQAAAAAAATGTAADVAPPPNGVEAGLAEWGDEWEQRPAQQQQQRQPATDDTHLFATKPAANNDPLAALMQMPVPLYEQQEAEQRSHIHRTNTATLLAEAMALTATPAAARVGTGPATATAASRSPRSFGTHTSDGLASPTFSDDGVDLLPF